MSCGQPTAETVILSGGVRDGGSGALAWAQPVPLCGVCAGLGSRRQRVEGWLVGAAAVAASGLGAGAGLVAVGWGGWAMWSGGAAGLAAGAAGFVAARAASAAWLEPWLWSRLRVGEAPLAQYRGVELFYFREPRKGPDARFICLRMESDAAAASFARLNPQAMPLAAWEASYLRSERDG